MQKKNISKIKKDKLLYITLTISILELLNKIIEFISKLIDYDRDF